MWLTRRPPRWFCPRRVDSPVDLAFGEVESRAQRLRERRFELYPSVLRLSPLSPLTPPSTHSVIRALPSLAPPPLCAQHTKRPGYDHFGGFFGRGVFTADGEEWRRKRATVAHALFRGGRGSSSSTPDVGGGGGDGGGGGGGDKGLAVLANEEANSLLREVEALREGGGEGEEVSGRREEQASSACDAFASEVIGGVFVFVCRARNAQASRLCSAPNRSLAK